MKAIIAVLAALLTMSMATAAPSIDVNCDGPGWFNSNLCRDYELQDEFNTVTDYVGDNEGAWSKDEVGGGMSSDGLSYRMMGKGTLFDLYDTVVEYLATIFATRAQLEAQAERIDLIEARYEYPNSPEIEVLHQAALKKANRLNEPVILESGYICAPAYSYCVRTY